MRANTTSNSQTEGYDGQILFWKLGASLDYILSIKMAPSVSGLVINFGSYLTKVLLLLLA